MGNLVILPLSGYPGGLVRALAGCAATTDGGGAPADWRAAPTIGVSGTGRVHLKPDVAVAQVGVEAREDAETGRLTRSITIFVPEGNRHRRVRETHVLRL